MKEQQWKEAILDKVMMAAGRSVMVSHHILNQKQARRLKLVMTKYKKPQVKGKAIPLQAWTGPKGSRRLRLPDFKTIGT